MSTTIRNLGIVVGIIVVLVAGIFFYTKYFVKDATTGLITEETAANFPGSEIKAQLERVRGLKLEAGNALFADATYKTLHDSTVTLVDEPQGRPNPFAPVFRPVVQPIQKSTKATTKTTATKR